MNSAEAYNWDECKREQMEERGHLLVLSRIPPAGLPLERTILFSPVNIDCKTLDLWIWVSIFFLFCVELLSFPWQIVPSESSNGSSLTLGRQRGSLFNVHIHPLWMVTSSSFSLPFLTQSFKKKNTKQTNKKSIESEETQEMLFFSCFGPTSRGGIRYFQKKRSWSAVTPVTASPARVIERRECTRHLSQKAFQALTSAHCRVNSSDVCSASCKGHTNLVSWCGLVNSQDMLQERKSVTSGWFIRCSLL